MTVFKSYAEYYDKIYEKKDYQGEIDYITAKLAAVDPNFRTLIDFGCGTGRHLQLLAKAGFEVMGVDSSRNMTDLARIRNPDLEIQTDDIRKFRIARKFDVASSLFHVISYQTSYADLNAAVSTVAHHLNDCGVFVFDVWHGPAVLHLKPETRVSRHQFSDVEVTRIVVPSLHENLNQVDVNIHILIKENGKWSELRESHKMRYYFVPEIEYFLNKNGFELVLVESWMENCPPSLESWSAMYLARKN